MEKKKVKDFLINCGWGVFIVSILLLITNFSRQLSLVEQSSTFYGVGIAFIISIILIIIGYLIKKKN